MILCLLSNWIRKRLHPFRALAGFCNQMRHSFNMPSWLLQVEILGFLQTGGVGLVAARKAELPRNDQRRPAFGESLQYHAVMRITNVSSQVMMANRARKVELPRNDQRRPAFGEVSLYNIML